MNDLAHAANIEDAVQDLLDAAGAPGAAVALSIDGQPWSAGIGHADFERTAPLAADARFSVYSITKTIIAAIAMRLVEDKLFALDDKMQSFLPDLPIETPVSIRQLLNHTGGIPDYGGLPAYHAAVRDRPGTPWSRSEFLKRTLGADLLFMPGHGWRYSNIGYLLVRQIMEQEAGFAFPNLVRYYLTTSFNLDALTVAASLKDTTGLTPGYSKALSHDDTLENVIPRYHPGWVSHGLITSTATGLARFLDLLFTGAMLEPPWLDAMLIGAPVADTHPWMSKPAYGLGLMMDPRNRFGVVAGHAGGGPGYSTAAFHFADVHGHRVTSVALVNRDGSDVATDIAFTNVERLADHLATAQS